MQATKEDLTNENVSFQILIYKRLKRFKDLLVNQKYLVRINGDGKILIVWDLIARELNKLGKSYHRIHGENKIPDYMEFDCKRYE